MKDIIEKLKRTSFVQIPDEMAKHILDIEIPQPFCFDQKAIKAFVLGTDPSNFSDDGKPKTLHTVFGIGTGDARYFSGILSKLKAVGLSLETIYVLNLIPHFLSFEPSGNKKLWLKFAETWLDDLNKRLDETDPEGSIPVFATAEILFKFLRPDLNKLKPTEIYHFNDQNNLINLLTNSSERMKRVVVPFYRHFRYQLSNPEFARYTSFLKTILPK
jgi:hypothetical protein